MVAQPVAKSAGAARRRARRTSHGGHEVQLRELHQGRVERQVDRALAAEERELQAEEGEQPGERDTKLGTPNRLKSTPYSEPDADADQQRATIAEHPAARR